MRDSYASQLDPSTKEKQQVMQRQKQTIIISLTVSFLFAVISAIIYLPVSQSPTPNYFAFFTPIAVSIFGLISAWLAWRGHANLGANLLLFTVLIISLGMPIVGHGQGVAVGVLVMIIGIAISYTTLPPSQSNRGSVLSIITGTAVIVIDLFIPDFGLYSDPIYTQIISIVSTIIFITVIARQFQTLTLQVKLVIAFATITIIPLVILGVYNNYTSTQALTEESRNQLSALSKTISERYDNFILEKLDTILTEAKQTALIEYLSLPYQYRETSPLTARAQNTLQTFQRKDPIFIDSYGILDLKGMNILDTSPEDLGRDESKEPYFTKVIETGHPYASNVVFLEDDEPSIYFSAPIKNSSNQIIGVLRVEYRATILQSIARAIVPDDPGVLILVVDQDTYMRLAYTGNRDELFTSYKDFSNLEIIEFQNQGKMPAGTRKTLLAGVNERTVKGIDNIETEPFFDTYSGSLNSEAINTGVTLQTQPWVAIVRESYTNNLETVKRQTRNIILISLALAGGSVLLALMAAQVLAAPLISLGKVVEQITSGDINARAEVTTRDEVGLLAESFNRMTEELNITLSSLEQRVAERTTDLEITQKNSEKRARELESISETSKVIAGEQKLEILLPLITRLVSERFGFYHTGIFLIDETRQFVVLQASNSEGGRKMLARGHRLDLGNGIVGHVAQYGSYRIALDVGTDAVFFNNADLPNTHSEMALPLKARNQIIGVLDVQSDKRGAFNDNDAKTLSILADQISISIENAKLFETTQKALNEAQTLYRQNLREGWVSFIQEENVLGYHQNIKGGTKLMSPIETDEIKYVLQRGNSLVVQPGESAQQPSIVIPIKLRGQVIGSLSVQAPEESRQWTGEEIALTEAISERLSIAIENARLIQESQRQVIKQQTIGDITEKISTSINLKNVLQVAVEELGRVMPGSEVVLKLTKNDDTAR
jgi:GAF domain-containing protein/HAMP domain-containing protein